MSASGQANFESRQQSNSNLAAVLLMICAAGFAYWATALPASISVYLIGSVSLTALAMAVWLKHRSCWELNAELLFLAGIAAQYLAAPVLLRLCTNNLTDFKLVDIEITAERAEAHESHAGAMLIVLGYLAAFFFASNFIRRVPLPRKNDAALEVNFSRGSLWLLIALTVVLWLTRLILLKTGSYYHLDRSDFQFDDPRYSMLAQIDSIIGPLVVTYFFIRGMLTYDALRFPAFTIVGLDCAWNFISGSRERALIAVLSMGVSYILVRKRLSMRMLLPALLAGVLIIGFMDYYRYAVRESGSASEIKVSRVLDAFESAKSKSANVGAQQTVISALARISDLDPIAAIYRWVPETVDYLRGQTYWNVLLTFVPRPLWPDKPPMTLPVNSWFFTDDGGSSPTTIMGEGFLNFGWLGVLLAGLGTAFLIRGTDYLICRHARNPLFLPIYVSFLLNVSRVHTEPAAVLVGFMLKYALLILGSHLLLRIIEPQPARPLGSFPARLAVAPET